MKNTIKKALLGAAMLAGAATATAAPADARVVVGFGIGGGYPAYAYCDRYSRWYDPYRCDDYDYYSGPVFIDGIWLNGGYRSRWYGGHREFFYRDRWYPGSGWHTGGFGHYGHGGWGGWHHH